MKAKNYFAHLNMNAANRFSEKQQDKKNHYECSYISLWKLFWQLCQAL